MVRRRSDGAVKWSSGTRTPGSTLTLFQDGDLVIRAPNGKWLWRTATRGSGTERVQLHGDGTLRLHTSTWVGTRRLAGTSMLWGSHTGRVK